MSRKTQTPSTANRAAKSPPESAHVLARCLPRGDRVVVRRDVAGDKTPGGVYLAGAGAKRQTGVVHAVGPGKYDDSGELVPINLKKGDRVIITGWAGLEIDDPNTAAGQDDEFVILREDDILAVIPPA